MISSKIVRKVEDDKTRVKMNEWNLEQLGKLRAACDIMDVFYENFNPEYDDEMTNKVKGMCEDLKENIMEDICSGVMYGFDIQGLAQKITEEIDKIVIETGYADGEDDAYTIEYEAYQTLGSDYTRRDEQNK